MKQFFLLLSAFAMCLSLQAQILPPPVAEKVVHQTIIHGDTLADPYFWMRDKFSTEVVNYLYANNAYADAMMKESTTLQKVLYDEMRGRIRENRETRPYRNEHYLYYTRYIQDKDYPVICRKKDSLQAAEQIVLDLNKLAQEFMYFRLSVNSTNPAQNLLAYAVDTKGNNVGRLFIKDIDGDSLLSNETLAEVLDFAWAEDGKTFYYTIPEPKTLRSYRLYRHVLGNSFANDELLYEESDKTFQVSIGKTSSKQFMVMTLSKTKSTEYWYWSATDNNDKMKLFMKRQPEMQYSLNHYEGNEFYIQTNYNAKNYQLMRAPLQGGDPARWVPVIPGRKGVMLQRYSLLKDFLIWEETENAQARVLIKNRQTNVIDTIKPSMELYEISYGFEDYHYATTKEMEYSVTNMIRPTEEYRYNLYDKTTTLIETDSLNEKYDASQYEVKRVYARSHDGVMVPMTLAYKKGLTLNGNNPVIMQGYGSYGSSNAEGFSSINISYMNRGFIVAETHIRGGRELGEEWYENGKMLNKKNTFYDFIACAEFLVKEKYTNPKKLAIQGGSAGGLLMGAVVNMRPDLFQCVVAQVPFVDVINTMLDESIPLTTFEFDEWGNPKVKKYYDYIKTYSPYDNVQAVNYPDMLVTAGYNDAQVGYWEPAKWVAKMREMKTDTNLLLFKTTMEGGHQGSSGRYASLKETAFNISFIMRSLGVKENYITLKGKVIDANNEPVSYANVFVEGTGIGTNTNDDGYFSLRLKDATNASVMIQSMGYESQRIKVNLDTRTRDLVVKLKSQNVLLRNVQVTANAKDPALGIIREAIKRRKDNFDRVKSFSSDVYMKSHVRLDEIPKKMPAFLKLLSDGEQIDSTKLGLVYLSESVAKYNMEKPDHVKEEMIASRVAGQGQGFSWNRVEDVFMNFYKPTIDLTYYSDRPFVSPIAPLATLSYKYKFRGSFFVDKKEVNKIEVIPLRKGDPLFKGYIYITQDDYQVYGADLMITKDANISFVDTVFLQQETINIDNTWMPLQMKISSHVKIFGFRATDMSMATMSNYNVNRTFPPKFFTYEVFNVQKNANKKDSQYWQSTRTVVLTEEEQKHYIKSDSVFRAHNTPEYLDSMDRRRNQFKWHKLLFGGYSYSKRTDSTVRSFNTSALPFTLGYNTVEGMFINYRLFFYKLDLTTRKYTYFAPVIRYGFINENLAGGLLFGRALQPSTGTVIAARAGRFIEQYNQSEPINSIVNTGYTLIDRQNFAKLLQKDVLSVTLRREVANGLYGSVNVQYQSRQAMVNHADYSFASKDKRDFTSNNPLNPLNDAPAFVTHQAAEYQVSFRYVPMQRYETYPEYKNVLGSRYPDIYVSFKHGVGLDKIKFNYQYLEAGTGKDIDLKLLGRLSFDVNAGMFFNTKSMAFMDYKHFNGNQTMFLHNPDNRNSVGESGRSRLTSFHALNYYTYSTSDRFFEVHAMQNFKGFFIGKIPLLRIMHAHEIVGVNFVATPAITYNELYLGLSNIFSVLRVDAGRVTSSGANNNWFMRIGLAFDF